MKELRQQILPAPATRKLQGNTKDNQGKDMDKMTFDLRSDFRSSLPTFTTAPSNNLQHSMRGPNIVTQSSATQHHLPLQQTSSSSSAVPHHQTTNDKPPSTTQDHDWKTGAKFGEARQPGPPTVTSDMKGHETGIYVHRPTSDDRRVRHWKTQAHVTRHPPQRMRNSGHSAQKNARPPPPTHMTPTARI